MRVTAALKAANDVGERARRGFKPDLGNSRVNVRDFIQCTYVRHEGEPSFQTGAKERTPTAHRILPEPGRLIPLGS